MKKLYFGGTILTMDKAAPRAEALLTENGRILATGNYEDLLCDAEPIDLQGATLMPGFVDGHSHLASVGQHLSQNCDLMGCTGFDDLLGRIRAFREKRRLVNGQPINARGYDPAVMAEGQHPTARLLDSLGIDNPIRCVHISGHVAAVNTRAMELAGVLEPGYTVPKDGFAGRDENGNLNGYFEEAAMAPFKPFFTGDTSDEAVEAGILEAQELYIRNGFTTVQDGSGNDERRLRCYRLLADAGKLKVDVVAFLGGKADIVSTWDDILAENGREYRNHLKVGGVKIFLDGSPQARTAWLRQPYEDSPDYCGYPTQTREQTAKRIAQATEHGLQIMAHCNGDAACEQFLSCWEETGRTDLRPVMIHAQFVGFDQLERMAKRGMMASFFVGHCWHWGDTHLKNMGERGMRISPTAQALALGVPFSLHQDSPVTTPDMLHSVWCASRRLTREGVQLDKSCAIDPYDALIAATRGGAYSYFEEDTKGILRPGAVADFVILDKDPTEADPRTVRVLQTIKEDTVLYKA